MARQARSYKIFKKEKSVENKKVSETKCYVQTYNMDALILSNSKEMAKVFTEKETDAFLRENTTHDWFLVRL